MNECMYDVCTYFTHACACMYVRMYRYSSHLNETDTFHSVIYMQSDLDHSTISGATCGSAHQDINKTVIQQQVTSYKQMPDEHMLRKRQNSRNTAKVRCWLNVVLDYKYYAELTSNNEDPASVLFGIILTVSGWGRWWAGQVMGVVGYG